MRTNNTQSADRAFLFIGEIDSRRNIEMNKIIDSMVDVDYRIFDLEEMSGDINSASDILSAVSTIPMGTGRKIVVVDKAERLSSGDQSKLASAISRLSDNSCLILLCSDNSKPKKIRKTDTKQIQKSNDDADGADSDDMQTMSKTSKESGKGLSSELANAVKSCGKVITYTKMKTPELKPLISLFIQNHDKKIGTAALDLLARSLEMNPLLAEKEIEKLAAYLGERNEITEADINEMVNKPDEDRVFPLIDAIASAQPASAAQLLNETFAASSKPDAEVLKTLSLLSRHFRILYQTKFLATEARELKLGADEAAQYLMKEQSPLGMQEWQLNKINMQAKHFSKKELQWCLKQILNCELAAKGIGNAGGTPRLNLETLIFRLSLRREKRR